jgi:hypothetical protein
MTLRLVLWVQLALVAFFGAFCRGLVPYTEGGWAESLVYGMCPLILLGFPLTALIAARRAKLSEGRGWLVALVEAALIYAYLLALLPAVQ